MVKKSDHKIKPEDVPTKGHDFPKNEIPTELEPKGKESRDKEGATVFDWIKNKFDILFNIVGNAKKTIDKYLAVVPDIKLIMYLGIALAVLVLIIIIVA